MNKNINGRVVLGLVLAVALSGRLAAQQTPGGIMNWPYPVPLFTTECDPQNPGASQAFKDCENSAYTLIGGKDYTAFVNKWGPKCATYCATQQWQGHQLGCGDYDFKSTWDWIAKQRCKLTQIAGTKCTYTYGFPNGYGRCCSLPDKATNWPGYVINAAITTCSLSASGGTTTTAAPTPPAPGASRVSPMTGTGLTANTGQTLAFSVLCAGTNLSKVEWHFNGVLDHSATISGASASNSWSKQIMSAGSFGVRAVCVDANNKSGWVAWMGNAVLAAAPTLAPPSSVPSAPVAPGTPAPPSGYSPGAPSAPVTPSVPQYLTAQWGGFSQGAHHVGRGHAQNVANSCSANTANSISNWARKQVDAKTGRKDCAIQNLPELRKNAGSASGKYDCSNRRGRVFCSGYCNAPARSLTVNYLCP